MKLRLIDRDADLVRVGCEGTITLWPANAGSDPLGPLLGADAFRQKVLLDLGGAEHLDSSGISWLISTHQRFSRAGGRLVLHSPSNRVREILELVSLPGVIAVADDEAGARALAAGEQA
jgi:anti-anti-sigma factor